MLCTSLLMRPQPPLEEIRRRAGVLFLELRQALSHFRNLPESDSGKITELRW